MKTAFMSLPRQLSNQLSEVVGSVLLVGTVT